MSRDLGQRARFARASDQHAKEIAKRVLASGRCAGLKSKTPEATISAMLAVGSKPSDRSSAPRKRYAAWAAASW